MVQNMSNAGLSIWQQHSNTGLMKMYETQVRMKVCACLQAYKSLTTSQQVLKEDINDIFIYECF